jgi:hypothetical protein
VKCRTLLFSRHATERMLQRRISPREVRPIVERGEVVEEDAQDRPFPSFLLLGIVQGRALHVVLGYDEATETGYVITTYVPDLNHWLPDWKTRRTR